MDPWVTFSSVGLTLVIPVAVFTFICEFVCWTSALVSEEGKCSIYLKENFPTEKNRKKEGSKREKSDKDCERERNIKMVRRRERTKKI